MGSGIELTLLETERALSEWAYWCVFEKDAAGPKLPTCRSAESAWNSPQVWQPEQPKPRQPNNQVGEWVQKAYICLDMRFRMVIGHWYVLSKLQRPVLKDERRVDWCARRCGVAAPLFLTRLDDARDAMRQALADTHKM